MTKDELLEMAKIVKSHCDNIKGGCHRCDIKKECDKHFRHAPTFWDFGKEVSE